MVETLVAEVCWGDGVVAGEDVAVLTGLKEDAAGNSLSLVAMPEMDCGKNLGRTGLLERVETTFGSAGCEGKIENP